jgi:hypothetical protein
MVSSGTIKLVAVFEMLDTCAPGHVRLRTDHYWRISYEGKTYPTLPRGAHGAMGNKEIERGHVKRLVRFFGLMDCARRVLPQLVQ